MKSTIKTAAWICAILLVSVSCYDDGTDCFDTATRISLYPDVELFNADGTTVFLVEQNANQALRIANREVDFATVAARPTACPSSGGYSAPKPTR